MIELERKFAHFGDGLTVQVDAATGPVIEGYASLFGVADQGGDLVHAGAYAASLAALKDSGRGVKMLWQHDPAQPIGVWDDVREDAKGLYVKGRLLPAVARGREAMALIEAGALDGLSIGYRTVRAERSEKGQRVLREVELWEVSLVTFPMLPTARVVAQKSESGDDIARALTEVFDAARREMAWPPTEETSGRGRA